MDLGCIGIISANIAHLILYVLDHVTFMLPSDCLPFEVDVIYPIDCFTDTVSSFLFPFTRATDSNDCVTKDKTDKYNQRKS